jgi:hypothetical protein
MGRWHFAESLETHSELLDLKEVSVKMTFRYPKSQLVLSGLVV